MTRIIRKALIVFGGIAALLILLGLIVALKDSNPSSSPMPSPNGYDDLVKAAIALKPRQLPVRNIPTQRELAENVSQNTEALELTRLGITRECRVPLQQPLFIIGTRTDLLAIFRRLGQALEFEGQLAELETRPADAAQSYLAVIRLGQEIARGGVLIDAMVGSSIESSGLTLMAKLAPQLTAEQCRLMVSALDSADTNRETVQNIVHQEKVWARRTYGWRYYMHPIVIGQASHRAAGITEQSDRTRKLMIKLAARAFELEHGAKPKSISDLVPAYLKTVPKDAFTGKDMTYPP